MSQRILRVNELLKREMSIILHTLYQKEAVAITITEVVTAADLRSARVYYSVVGTASVRTKAAAFFVRNRARLRYQIGRRIVLKYLPDLQFIYDPSIERGMRLVDIIDEMAIPDDESEALVHDTRKAVH